MLKEIKTANIKQQALERIMLTSYLSSGFIKLSLKSCQDEIEAMEEDLEGKDKSEDDDGHLLDYENQLLQQFCTLSTQLVDTYEDMLSMSTLRSEIVLAEVKQDYQVEYMGKIE